MTTPTPSPTTSSGRALLAQLEAEAHEVFDDLDVVTLPSTADAILAIEREAAQAAGLDVERLARALEGMGILENGAWVHFEREDAEEIADRYAAAAQSPEAGEGRRYIVETAT